MTQNPYDTHESMANLLGEKLDILCVEIKTRMAALYEEVGPEQFDATVEQLRQEVSHMVVGHGVEGFAAGQTCHCSDRGCPHHAGSDLCQSIATTAVRHVDGGDKLPVCADCFEYLDPLGIYEEVLKDG